MLGFFKNILRKMVEAPAEDATPPTQYYDDVTAYEQTHASSEWMASSSMPALLQTMKREFRSRVIILDLPPLLAADDVLSISPHLQSVLLIAEAGSTSVSEIKECTKHLKDTPVVRVVINKITEREPTSPYHEYY